MAVKPRNKTNTGNVSSARYNNSREALRATAEISAFMHPDYQDHASDWALIRDCVNGERRVKERGTQYLPSIGKEGQSYADYLQRAVYVNMTGRTISALTGTVFRRPLKITGATTAGLKALENCTAEGYGLNLYGKLVTREVLTTGRAGLLLDRPVDNGKAYLTIYAAENVLSWQEARIEGRRVPTYVLLREVTQKLNTLGDGTMIGVPNAPLQIRVRYRALVLRDGIYQQDIYEADTTDPFSRMDSTQVTTVTPTHNGAPLNYIPFVAVGPESPSLDIQRSPVLDIATLNIAHYRTSAQLESGRYYTAIPVYWTNVRPGEEGGEYVIGPSTVLELPPEAKLGIAEYYGSGLSHLATSLLEKEQHISDLGGRVIHARTGESSMSDQAASMKNANETSILLNVTESVSTALTTMARWFLEWENFEGNASAKVLLNQDFKLMNIGAREFRAVALLYQSGILPIQEVYRIFQENEFIGETVTLEEFRKQLSTLENFPNQPNVAALHDGLPDASAGLTDEAKVRQQAHEKALLKMEMDAKAREGAKQRASAEEQAAATRENAVKVAAATPPVAGGKPPAPGGVKPQSPIQKPKS